MRELEIEEEHLTNALQKKLNTVRQEKSDMENEVSRLKDYLNKMDTERAATARRVEEEEEYLTNALTKKLNIALSQKQELEIMLSRENSSKGSTRSNSIDISGHESESPGSQRSRSVSLSRSSSNNKQVVYKFL